MSITCVLGVLTGQRTLDTLKLESHIIVNHHVGAGIRTWVLWKKSVLLTISLKSHPHVRVLPFCGRVSATGECLCGHPLVHTYIVSVF